MKRLFCFLLLASLFAISSLADAHPSFFLMGSGEISLKNVHTGQGVKTRYRTGENQYDEGALRKINRVYGSSYEDPASRMSLRFIELLSYLQNHFGNAPIEILSGFRSLTLNEGLRNHGKLAAGSSMHIEAAAADIRLPGVEITQVRDWALGLPCCGVGYYHGKHIHLDTGPKRWWDEKTSGTEKKEPQENEKIIALTSLDIYAPSEKIQFDFARVSDYPIDIPGQVSLEKLEKGEWRKGTDAKVIFSGFVSTSPSDCHALTQRKMAKNISLETKGPLPAGRYRLGINFCNKRWGKMPERIYSNEFELTSH